MAASYSGLATLQQQKDGTTKNNPELYLNNPVAYETVNIPVLGESGESLLESWLAGAELGAELGEEASGRRGRDAEGREGLIGQKEPVPEKGQ